MFNAELIRERQVHGDGFTSGVYVAAVGGSPQFRIPDDVLVGPVLGGVPFVNVFEGTRLTNSNQVAGATFTGGVRVQAGYFVAGGGIVTGFGPGGLPLVKVLVSNGGLAVSEFLAFDATMTVGVFVTAGVR